MPLMRHCLLIAVCMVLLVAPGAPAQNDGLPTLTLPPADRTLPDIEVAVAAMLDSDWTLANTAEDAVWRVTPQPGRRLVQIPLKLTPALDDADLTTNVINIRGGRVLCYRIEEPGTEEDHQTLLGAETPHFTRSIKLTTKNRLEWSLDRYVARGAEVKSSQLPYAMLINRDLLREADPGAPPVIVKQRDETTAQYYARARSEEATYKSARARYLDLKRLVNDLPTDFAIDNQPRIWVVGEVHDQAERIEIDAKGALSWSISFDQLRAMKDMLRNAPEPIGDGAGKRWSEQVYRQITMMNDLLDDEHVYSYRMVSHTLHQSGVIVHTRQGDPVYELMQRVLAGPDSGASLQLAKALIAASPHNPQLLKLADSVMDKLDPSSRLLGLKNLLGTRITAATDESRETLRVTLNTVNRLLSDENADVSAVVRELYTTVEAQPEAVTLLGNGVRFDGLDEAQRDTVIGTIIDDAATQPLARRWLDVRLISSDDEALRARTLEMLAERAEDVIAEQAKVAAGDEQAPVQSAEGRTNPLAIPIDTSSHGLLRLLDTRNQTLRDLAWAALPSFRLSQPTGEEGASNLQGMFDRIGALAARQGSTPQELVMFLRNHAPGDQVNTALALVVLQANATASGEAARWLLDHRADISAAMTRMNYRERESFVVRLYEGLGRSAPFVVGLLRSRADDNPLPNWFTEQIKAGTLPDDAAWGEAYGGERALLPLVVSSDDDLAVAAAAGLMHSIRSDAAQAPGFVAQCKALEDQSIDSLKAQWDTYSQEAVQRRIAGASGDYRAMLVIHEKASGVENRIDLGIVQLTASGGAVQFANQPMSMRMVPGRMAIELTTPAELANFPTDALDFIPIDEVEGPIELTYIEGDGQWTVSFDIPATGPATLTLSPVEP